MIYRTVQYRDSDDGVEQILYEGSSYQEAHFQALQYDGDFYPEFYHVVERSHDQGTSWDGYSASEIINGRPAWVDLT
jgi:hypothetical protein